MDNEEFSRNDQAITVEVDKKLTEWENEPNLSDIKQDFLDSSSDHDAQVIKVSKYLDNLNITGSTKRAPIKGRSNIQPKLIRKQAEWRYSSLSEPFLSTEDLFNISPVSAEDKAAAIQNELVLNNQFNTKINKVGFIDEYIRTVVDEGTVIVRVGWESEEEEVTKLKDNFRYVQSQDPKTVESNQRAHALATTSPDVFLQLPEQERQAYQIALSSGVPTKAVYVNSTEVTELVETKNNPTVEVCDYRNVRIDPTCNGDINKAKFVVYSFETSLTDLEKAGIYTNLDDINISTSSIFGDPDHASNNDGIFEFKDKPRKKVVAYEYWGYYDINNTGIVEPIVVTYVNDTIIRMELNPYPDRKLPFVIAQYLPVRKSTYGEPDGVLLEDNQQVIGAVTRGAIDIMARGANGQMGIAKGALDITNQRKYEAGEHYQFNPGVGDPRNSFYMHTYDEIPRSAEVMLNMQNADAESLTGVKSFSSTGISGQSLGATATGVRSAMDATSKRELGILRRVAAGITEIGRKIIGMNSEFLADTEVVRVTNEEFVRVRRDDLAGNFDLKLAISTAEADNQKAEELAFMLQTTAQSMGPEFTKLILSDIARLRKMPTLMKKIEEYAPKPDPLQQEIQKLEIAKLQAEIREIESRTFENYQEGKLDSARTMTEQAKTRNLSSDSDLKDLNFLEQQSGVGQERDLQKINQQAESNAQLKAVESSLNNNSVVDDITTTNGVKSI